MKAIERLLVDWFDSEGCPTELRGAEWFLILGDREVPLTCLAFAIVQLNAGAGT